VSHGDLLGYTTNTMSMAVVRNQAEQVAVDPLISNCMSGVVPDMLSLTWAFMPTRHDYRLSTRKQSLAAPQDGLASHSYDNCLC
jgi:hypothetical protein